MWYRRERGHRGIAKTPGHDDAKSVQRDASRLEHLAVAQYDRRPSSVNPVAQKGRPAVRRVHAYLMRSAGEGSDGQHGLPSRSVPHGAITRNRGRGITSVNLAEPWIGRAPDRAVPDAIFRLGRARGDGQIQARVFAARPGAGQSRGCLSRKRENDYATHFAIESRRCMQTTHLDPERACHQRRQSVCCARVVCDRRNASGLVDRDEIFGLGEDCDRGRRTFRRGWGDLDDIAFAYRLIG